MCGIAGCLSVRDGGELIADHVAAMTRALSHRGPDDEGLLVWRRGSEFRALATEKTVEPHRSKMPYAEGTFNTPWEIALGHRRFSILDVTPNGHQPFVDLQGRAALVFNGEIYNFIELRHELEKYGIAFRTRSDTEVLLQAYLYWGEEMLSRLNGMWAFALLDFRTGRLLLSRDRVGKKSLFYTRVGDRFYFASEIKSLFAVPEIWAQRKVHDDLVRDYLFLGLRDHTYESMFDGIVNLPPATYAWIDKHSDVRPQSYWRLPKARCLENDISYEEAKNRLLELLADSVAIRLRADVPLAAELSGGMDSTTVVALAARRLGEQNGAPGLRTYTIHYGNPEYDETAYALKTAAISGAEFNPVMLTANNYWEKAESMLHVLEQPYESPNLLGCLSMWTLMKGCGIRVSLNGGAGDELLAGYISGHLMPFLHEMLAIGDWGKALREVRAWWGTQYLNSVVVRRYVLNHLPAPLRQRYIRRMLALPEYAALTPPPSDFTKIVSIVEKLSVGRLSTVLMNNMEYAPIPMYVVQSDKISMSIPIELRYPFLDCRLMDFAFQLPVSYLMSAGRSKNILRDAAKGLIPEDVINRREKMGFPVPLKQWMQEGMPHIHEQLSNNARSARFINGAAVMANMNRLSEKTLWRIHQVELWMRIFDLK